MAKTALTTGLLTISLLLVVAGLTTVPEDFGRFGLSLPAVGAAGILVWLFLFIRKTRKDNESLSAALAAARAATDDPRSRLLAISHRFETLMNSWEEYHPAGGAAWRAEVNILTQEAEQIISDRYPEQAARFRGLKPEDAREYPEYIKTQRKGELSEGTKREFLLQAKIKFLHQLVYGSSN